MNIIEIDWHAAAKMGLSSTEVSDNALKDENSLEFIREAHGDEFALGYLTGIVKILNALTESPTRDVIKIFLPEMRPKRDMFPDYVDAILKKFQGDIREND